MNNQISVHLATGNDATDHFINAIFEALNQYTIAIAKQQIRIKFEQSEKEVTDIRQRTKEGIETGRLNGSQIGHPVGTKLIVKKAVEAKKIIREHSKDFDGSLDDKMCRNFKNMWFGNRAGFHVHPAYVKESCDEIERMSKLGIRLIVSSIE